MYVEVLLRHINEEDIRIEVETLSSRDPATYGCQNPDKLKHQKVSGLFKPTTKLLRVRVRARTSVKSYLRLKFYKVLFKLRKHRISILLVRLELVFP